MEELLGVVGVHRDDDDTAAGHRLARLQEVEKLVQAGFVEVVGLAVDEHGPRRRIDRSRPFAGGVVVGLSPVVLEGGGKALDTATAVRTARNVAQREPTGWRAAVLTVA